MLQWWARCQIPCFPALPDYAQTSCTTSSGHWPNVILIACHTALHTESASVLQICCEEEAAAAKQRLEALWLSTKRVKHPSEIAGAMAKNELEQR